jgi:RimJ/RimL family protein N-acetyltransferase
LITLQAWIRKPPKVQHLTGQHNKGAASVPVIETKRLILRGHAPADFDDCLAMWSDPEVTRFIGGRPFNGEDVWARLLRYAGHWQWLGYGYWLVAEKKCGEFIGEVGFADFKRIIAPSFEGIPEVGWALASWAWGCGYASEAVAAVVRWGEGHFGEEALTGCLIHPDNLASIRVALKCGYKEFCRTTYKEHAAIIYRRPS